MTRITIYNPVITQDLDSAEGLQEFNDTLYSMFPSLEQSNYDYPPNPRLTLIVINDSDADNIGYLVGGVSVVSITELPSE